MLGRWARLVLAATLLTACGASPPGPDTSGIRGGNATPEFYLYMGEVEIEPVPPEHLRDRLARIGCPPTEEQEDPAAACQATLLDIHGRKWLTVYPNGFCLGPCSLIVLEGKLHAQKTFTGPIDRQRYKERIRAEVRKLGDFVKIREDTWRIQTRDARNILFD
ncbi:hypothetical protein ACMHYB_24190 [Sorangium sp. So ce1128]